MMFNKNNNEKVKKRRSYYGFAKNYPGKLGSSKYVIGDSKKIQRRDFVRRIIIILMLAMLFAVMYIITAVCFEISDRPVENTVQPFIMIINQLIV